MTNENSKNITDELQRREEEINRLWSDNSKLQRELQNLRTDAEKEIKELKENLNLLIKTTQERNRENLHKFYNSQGIINRADMAKTDIQSIYGSVVSIPPHLIPTDMSASIIDKMQEIKDGAGEVINKLQSHNSKPEKKEEKKKVKPVHICSLF